MQNIKLPVSSSLYWKLPYKNKQIKIQIKRKESTNKINTIQSDLINICDTSCAHTNLPVHRTGALHSKALFIEWNCFPPVD